MQWCNRHNVCNVCNICIVKCHTDRVLLYYVEGYIKKGTPKEFRHCEIVIIILRRLVRVTESSKEYYQVKAQSLLNTVRVWLTNCTMLLSHCASKCSEYHKSITGCAEWITRIVRREITDKSIMDVKIVIMKCKY